MSDDRDKPLWPRDEQPDKTEGDPLVPDHDREQADTVAHPSEEERPHGDPLSPGEEGEVDEAVSEARPVLPPDPAGTQPKVEPSTLLPARREPLLRPRAEEPRELAVAAGGAGGDDGGGAVAVASEPAGEAPHSSRFQFLLGALIAFAVAGVALLALSIGGRATEDTSQWSPWRPTDDGAAGARQIADHVGPQYRLPSRDQLVLVTGGEMEIAVPDSGEGGGSEQVPMDIAKRDGAGNISLVKGDGILYRLCGLGPKCSIDKGKASVERHLLLRREAVELALYSFRYLRGVDHVVVFMPPRKGADPSQALFFRKDDLQPELTAPLRATLTAPAPGVNTVAKAPDTPLVNRVTQNGRGLFSFSLTPANQDSKVFLVLEPIPPPQETPQGELSPEPPKKKQQPAGGAAKRRNN